MINAPFLIFFVGAALAMLLPGQFRKWILLAVPIVGLLNLLNMDPQSIWLVQWLELELVLLSSDRLSFIFGVLFHL